MDAVIEYSGNIYLLNESGVNPKLITDRYPLRAGDLVMLEGGMVGKEWQFVTCRVIEGNHSEAHDGRVKLTLKRV